METALWGVQDGRPHLNGVRCRDCGAVFFPPQHYGCENCGADGARLEDAALAATGVLHGFTVVYNHRKEPTPFQVAEVLLDAGPILRARLNDLSPRIGARVTAAVGDVRGAEQLIFVQEEKR